MSWYATCSLLSSLEKRAETFHECSSAWLLLRGVFWPQVGGAHTVSQKLWLSSPSAFRNNLCPGVISLTLAQISGTILSIEGHCEVVKRVEDKLGWPAVVEAPVISIRFSAI